jgi:hypothetical protein
MVTCPSSAVATLTAVTTASLHVPVIPRPRRPIATPVEDRADPATRQRRRLHYAATLAGVRIRASLLPGGAVRRREALQVCSAARLLTALGIRVDVVQPGIAWPRHRTHRLAITNDAGPLGDLALLTAVPRTAVGWATVADRVLPAGATLWTTEPGLDDAVVCPVTIRCRTAAGPLTAPPRIPADAAAVSGLVVEVRLLPVSEGDRVA